MASIGGGYENRSSEWRHWLAHYKRKGCSYSKALKLSCKKMGY